MMDYQWLLGERCDLFSRVSYFIVDYILICSVYSEVPCFSADSCGKLLSVIELVG
jgi:hypothetical protein